MRQHLSGPMGRRLGWTFVWLLILAPVLITHHLMREHLVNIPFLDDFAFTPFLEKAQAGTLTLHDFFVVQMEHRLAWPRLIILLLFKAAPGNFAAQSWVTFILLCLTLINVGLLLRRTGRPFSKWWPLMVLSGLALFSPVQYQILLWPMMFQVVTPAWALTSSLVVLGSRWPLWLRFILCAILALVATLSIASGLLLWPLLTVVIVCSDALPAGRPRKRFAGAWLAIFTVTAVLYFHGLHNETDPQFSYRAAAGEITVGKGVQNLLQKPWVSLAFTLRFVGAHLARGTSLTMMTAALLWGALFVAMWVAALCWWLRQIKDASQRSQWIPWLVLGAYSIGTGFLVSLGRAWASTSGDNSLQSRYICHAIPLTIGLLVLGWMFLERLRGHPAINSDRIRQAAAAAVCLLLGAQIIEWSHGSKMMGTWASSRLRAAANTLFFKLKQPDLLNPKCELCANIDYACRLDSMKLLEHRMFRNNRLENFHISGKELSSNTARLIDVRSLTNDRMPRHTMLAEGHAALPKRSRVADALLFTYQDSKKVRRIFHVAQILEMPLFLQDTLGRDMRFLFQQSKELGQNLSRFAVEIPFSALPSSLDETKLELWLLDYRKWTVYPVAGDYRVRLRDHTIFNLRPGGRPATTLPGRTIPATDPAAHNSAAPPDPGALPADPTHQPQAAPATDNSAPNTD